MCGLLHKMDVTKSLDQLESIHPREFWGKVQDGSLPILLDAAAFYGDDIAFLDIVTFPSLTVTIQWLE